MTTRITGIVRDLEGQPLVNSHLRFERRSGVRAQDGATVVPRVVNAKTDSGGNIAVDLYPGEYSAQAERGSGALSFKVGVPEDVAQVQLQDLIDQVPAITPMWASETRQARDEAVEAAESTAGSVEAAEVSASAASDSADSAAGSATAAGESQSAAEGAQQSAEEARDEAEVFASVSPRVIYVATIADLQALDTSPLPDGQQVSVREYTEGTGRGGRVMVWDSASTEDDNGGTVIAPNSGDGRWLWDGRGDITPEMFGARGDGTTDNTETLKAFFEFLNTPGERRKGTISGETYMTDRIDIDVVTDIQVECIGQATIKGIEDTEDDAPLNWILFFDCETSESNVNVHDFSWHGGTIDNSLRWHTAGDATGEALRVRAFKNVFVENTTFFAGDSYLNDKGDSGIVPSKNASVVISGCKFIGQPDEGVYARQNGEVIATGNTFLRCWDGIRHTVNGGRFILSNNTFVECRTGTLASVRSGGSGIGRRVQISDNIFFRTRSRSVELRESFDGDLIANNLFLDWGYDLEGVRDTDDNEPAIMLRSCTGVVTTGNSFTFADLEADSDHVCARSLQYSPDGTELETRDCRFIANSIRAETGTIGTGFQEVNDSQRGIYQWNIVEDTANPYLVHPNSTVIRQGMLPGRQDFIRSGTSPEQMVRVDHTATENLVQGRSESGNAKVFRIACDANSNGLRMSAEAGNTDLDSDDANVRVGRNSDATFQIYRNGTSTLRHQFFDTAQLCRNDAGNVLIGGTNTGGAWDTAHLQMGQYRIWIDGSGNLRIKNGAPTSDTDGTVVGTQT